MHLCATRVLVVQHVQHASRSEQLPADRWQAPFDMQAGIASPWRIPAAHLQPALLLHNHPCCCRWLTLVLTPALLLPRSAWAST